MRPAERAGARCTGWDRRRARHADAVAPPAADRGAVGPLLTGFDRRRRITRSPPGCRPGRSPTTPSRRCCSAGCWSRATAGSTRRELAGRPARLGGVDAAARVARPARPLHQAGARRDARRDARRRGGQVRRHQRRRDAGHPGRHRRHPGNLRWPGRPGRRRPAASPTTRGSRWPAPRPWPRRSARASTAPDAAAATRSRDRGRRAGRAGRGHWVAAADVAARIRWAAGLVAGPDPDAASSTLYTLVGTSLATQESVPAAFAVLAAAPGRPLAGLPAGRVTRRRLRHDRRDGRGDRRRLPRAGRLPAGSATTPCDG